MSAKFWELTGTEKGEEVRYYFNTTEGILVEDLEAVAGSFIELGRSQAFGPVADEAAFVQGVAVYLSSEGAHITSIAEVAAIPLGLERNAVGGKPGTFLITLHKQVGEAADDGVGGDTM